MQQKNLPEQKNRVSKRADKVRWSAKCFGSRRGLLVTLWHQLMFCAGRYRRYKRIDWHKVERLVFVCKGNICRSAYAEALARQAACPTASFGLDTVDGAPANVTACEIARQRQQDLQAHRTTTLEQAEVKPGDLLIAMEPWQADRLAERFYPHCQVSLLGLWMQPVRPHLQDPYGLPEAYFIHCFGKIESAVSCLIKHFQKAHGQ